MYLEFSCLLRPLNALTSVRNKGLHGYALDILCKITSKSCIEHKFIIQVHAQVMSLGVGDRAILYGSVTQSLRALIAELKRHTPCFSFIRSSRYPHRLLLDRIYFSDLGSI